MHKLQVRINAVEYRELFGEPLQGEDSVISKGALRQERNAKENLERCKQIAMRMIYTHLVEIHDEVELGAIFGLAHQILRGRQGTQRPETTIVRGEVAKEAME